MREEGSNRQALTGQIHTVNDETETREAKIKEIDITVPLINMRLAVK